LLLKHLENLLADRVAQLPELAEPERRWFAAKRPESPFARSSISAGKRPGVYLAPSAVRSRRLAAGEGPSRAARASLAPVRRRWRDPGSRSAAPGGRGAALIETGVTDHRDSWNNVIPHIPPAGIRLTELAARAAMTKQAMAELVAEIERRGYIRRAKLIEFTDQGRAIVRLALSALGELEAEIVDRLGEPPVRQLRGALLEILDRPP
jgi:hypothetical protein